MADMRRKFTRAYNRTRFLVLRALVRPLQFQRMRGLGALLGTLQFHFQATQQRRVLHDLALLTRHPPGDPAVAELLRTAYRINTIAVLEILSMFDRKLDADAMSRSCRIDGLERLSAARAEGGAILLLTHAGNALLLAARLALEGWPITSVYRKAAMMTPEFFSSGLRLYGIEDVRANDGFKAYAEMLRALRNHRVVCMSIDQGVKRANDGLPMRFLGKDMPMPAGPAHLAKATGARILPVTTLAAAPVWHFAIEAPVEFAPRASAEEVLRVLLSINERQILSRPELWSWHHRRWRHFPLAAPLA